MDQGSTAEEKGCKDGDAPVRLDAIVPKPHVVLISHLAGHVERLLDDASEIGRMAVVFECRDKVRLKPRLLLMKMINRMQRLAL